MADTPKSYKDPYWTNLALAAEKKTGIPSGLLVNILTKGERTNADLVSEAGAKTPFQIIPQTRDAIIKKYGIDPYLNPENAAEGAALLLKEAIQRNNGDVAQAVGEYHGGVNRKNWGPRTSSYVQRVTGGAQRPAAPQSTFQRVMAENPQYQQPALGTSEIANIYDAYKNGRMTPEQVADFEKDVRRVAIVLPEGAYLNGEKKPLAPGEKPEPILLDQGITDAYVNGKMTPQQRADLEEDMKAERVKLRPTLSSQRPSGIPGEDYDPATWKAPTEQGLLAPEPVKPSFGERLVNAVKNAPVNAANAMVGLAETPAALVTGMASGLASVPVELIQGQKAAEKFRQDYTYAPRTSEGQALTGLIADAGNIVAPMAMPQLAVLSDLAPAAKLQALSQVNRAAQSAKASPIAQRAIAAAQSIPEAVSTVAKSPSKAVAAVRERIAPAAKPTPGTMPSGGSAGVDIARVRQEAAADLPVPVELTKGQATRDFGQLRFEQETAKNAELGAPIRERAASQQKAMVQNFDAWIDETGTQANDKRAVGISTDKAIRSEAAKDKVQIRTAYKEAEKAGEMETPVTTQPLVSVLNESVSAESTAPVLTAAKKELIRLGGAEELADGRLVAKDMTLANSEQLRRFINKTTGVDPTNIKFAVDLKTAIDAATDGAGGDLYKYARGLRSKYANKYENHAVISDLLNNKRGTADRKVALEDVFDRIVFQGSLDDMRHARKVIQTSGEEGQAAWKDIQGQALRYIRDEATKGVARDSYGNQIISPANLNKAIQRLDNEGKLDYLFGKRGAEKLRTVNDLSKVMFTTPPGAVNMSNTASVLLAAMDMALSGTAGMPLPVLSGIKMMVRHIKDKKLKARVQDALAGQKF